ncbi:MAG: futalosine hydrolase [Chitinophagaceae bacterium]|nr:futalosine hydrolase [Chitinophagaceae bacterium]
MQILLLAATEAEIQSIKTNHPAIDVLITGVGAPATIYQLQKKIGQQPYDLVVQAGVAGSFNDQIKLGTVVLVGQDCFADLGTEENGHFLPMGKTAFADEHAYPFENGWLKNPNRFLLNTHLPVTRAITVNKVSDSQLQKQQFIETWNPDIESMEGAALHFVCLQEKLPFIQIRSVSNYVGERDKTKWKLHEAIASLHAELTALLTQFTTL